MFIFAQGYTSWSRAAISVHQPVAPAKVLDDWRNVVILLRVPAFLKSWRDNNAN